MVLANPSAIQSKEILAGAKVGGSGAVPIVSSGTVKNKVSINVRDFGAKGDGAADDTAAINSAISHASAMGGGDVFIPDGTYMIEAVNSHIIMKNHVQLKLARGATLHAITNAATSYSIILARDVINTGIYGGSIRGDRSTHNGRTGEWGMGISLQGVKNINLIGINISDCWGDGIYISDDGNPENPSRGVYVDSVVSDNNRRQGLSAINWIGGTIINSTFKNTNGTPPAAGVDLEPDPPGIQQVVGITVKNNVFNNNQGEGIVFAPFKVERNTISNNTFSGNEVGIFVYSSNNIFSENEVFLNRRGGIVLSDRPGHPNYNASGNTLDHNKVWKNNTAASAASDILLIGRASNNNFIANVVGSEAGNAQSGVLVAAPTNHGNTFKNTSFVGAWPNSPFIDLGTETLKKD